jgi:DNA-directed RNA polymerase subunit H
MAPVDKIFKARNTLMKHLEARGFNVSEYKCFSMDQVAKMLEDKKLDLLVSNTAENRSIFIKFVEGRPDVHTIADDLFKPSFSGTSDVAEPPIIKPAYDLLIVTFEEVSNDNIIEAMAYLWDKHHIYVALTSVPRLQYDVLEHKDVPKYTIQTEKEAAAVAERYGTTLAQFPEINRNDPCAIAIGLRPGQMVHLKRSSATAGITDFYRVCVQ